MDWLATRLVVAPVLPAMPIPLFTRMLQAQAPPPAPAAPTGTSAKVRPVRSTDRLATMTPSLPTATATAADPEPVSEAMARGPVAPIEAPEPAASAATPVAAPPTAAASAEVTADSWPPVSRLSYRLGGRFRSGPLYGSARVQWLRRAARYEVRVEIDVTLLASLVLVSQGEVTEQGLRPGSYEELRRGSRRAVRFAERAVILDNGESVPLPEGVQDTASQFVELAHRFATGREVLTAGTAVTLWMARPGGIAQWTYDVLDRELLQTPQLGEIEAVHLTPRPIANPRGNITAEMWFAPSLQYLPVRIRINLGDEASVDLVVETIEQR